MDKNRFAKRIAVAAGFFLLCAAPGLTCAQSTPPSPAPTPHQPLPAARPKKVARRPDVFAGLTYTDDQKAKIDQIHQDMKSRTDAVVRDEKLSADQKDAMLEGYKRMEQQQVFAVLTPEQQKEVRERVRARRAAEQEEKKKRQSPPN